MNGNVASRCIVSPFLSYSSFTSKSHCTQVGPVMEAFGYQRIIFGSSPSSSSKGPSNVADWYEISRESLTELGIEQDFVDAVFYGNAEKVYSEKKQDAA